MAGGRKEYELLFKLGATSGAFTKGMQSAVNAARQFQGTLTQINGIQGKISGYKKQVDAINANKSKLQLLNEEHEKLKREMAATEAPSESLRKKFEKNEKQIQQTTQKISEQEKQLSDLQDDLKRAGVNTSDLAAENEKLAKSYDRVKKNQEELSRINAARQQNQQAISQVKGQLAGTVGVIGAMGAALYAGPVKKAAEFQAQMSTVQAISGATQEDMEILAAEAKKMGATTQFTAVEAGKALEYMGMAGWKTDQMLGGLPGIMNLAAASGEDLGMVSDIVTDALSAFGLQAEDAAHFADVLAAASSNSNTNVALLGESFKYAAPLAGSFGFSVEDTSLMLGLMANSGIKASNSGTALRKIFAQLSGELVIAQQNGSELVIATSNADGSMRNLKDIVDDVRGAFNGMSKAEVEAAQNNLTDAARSLGISLNDENGALKSQAQLYSEVTEGLDGLTAAGKVAEAESIAGKTAMAGLLTIVNASEEDYNKLANAIYNADGAAAEMARIKLDNYEGQVTLAKSAIEGLQIAVGTTLLPSLTTGIKKFTDFISKVAQFAEENPELVKTIMKVVGGFAAFRVASLGAKFGFLQLKQGFLDVQGIFTLFKGHVAGAGISAMNLKSKLIGVGTGIKGYFSGIKGALGGVGNMLQGGGMGKIGQFISAPIAKAFGGIKGMVGGLGGTLKGPLAKIGQMIAGPFGGIGKALGGVKNALGPIGNLIGKAFGPLGGIAGKVLPFVGVLSTVIAVISIVKDHLDDIRNFVGKIFGEAGVQVFDNIVNGITNIGKVIQGVFSGENLDGARNFIENTFGPQAVGVFDAFIGVMQTVGNVVKSFIDFSVTYVKPVIEEIFSFIVNNVLPVIAQKFTEWAPTICGIIEGISTVIQGIIGAIMQAIQFAMPLIKSLIGNAIDGITSVIGGLMNVIKGLLDFVVGVFTGDWEKAWNGVKSVFGGIWEAIGGAVKAPLNFIIDGINTLIGGLNKLTIPEWVPGVGGKGFNVPLIPKFAKGTLRTPETFIAGERGAELVTNAPNRQVLTAAQTARIFDVVDALKNAQPAGGAGAPQEIIVTLSPAFVKMLSGLQAAPAGAEQQKPDGGPGVVNIMGGPPAAAQPVIAAISPAFVKMLSSLQPAIVDANTQQARQITELREARAPEVRATAAGAQSITVQVTSNPVVHVDGNKPDDLDQKLEAHGKRLAQQIKNEIKQEQEDAARTDYEA